MDPIVYDKAKFHLDGNFPPDLPHHQAYVHTGMYIGWVIQHELYSDKFRGDWSDLIDRFLKREITGADIYETCDGLFSNDMLNAEGNEFTKQYFDLTCGNYLADYLEKLGGNLSSLYNVEDNWENFEIIRDQIEFRFLAWQKSRTNQN